MTRLALVIIALAASAACASTGAYAPRPFPTAPSPTPAMPAAAVRPVSTERAMVSAAVLTTAMELRGVPYRLGGSDPAAGFDCSGFVQYVLRQHAITMPRTVVEQFVVGDISPAVEPGDLVFFQTVGSKASHVGIALDGRSFVHAPNSRGVVRVERFDTPYWSSRFLGARRMF